MMPRIDDRDDLLTHAASIDTNQNSYMPEGGSYSNATCDIDTSSVSLTRVVPSAASILQDDPDGDYENSINNISLPMSDGTSIQSSHSDLMYAVDQDMQFIGLENRALKQAVVFLEDAYHYRSIDHKVNPHDLDIYRDYQSTAISVLRAIVIFVLHILAFLEYPSSLSMTSDLRSNDEQINFACWVTQTIELVCLMFLLLDNLIKGYLMGIHCFIRHKWDVVSMVIVFLSVIDWSVSFGLGCHEFVRYRRLFRPFFIIQHSSLMKKIVNCLRRTVPEIASVLVLMFLHLFIFTLFAMIIFPDIDRVAIVNSTVTPQANASTVTPSDSTYFKNLLDSLISLLVLLTTANNPDVTMPAYSKNRFASLFFVLYLLIGLYCFMNMLLAVIYNQFRGYFLSSMQRDLLRRRLAVRAAFEVLRRRREGLSTYSSVGTGVGGYVIQDIVNKSRLPKHVQDEIQQGLQGLLNRMLSVKQFQKLFYCMDKQIVHRQRPGIRWCEHPRLRQAQKFFIHKYFVYFGIVVSFINLIIISLVLEAEYRSSLVKNIEFLQSVNLGFIIYYFCEQLTKLWAYGWRCYLWDWGNIFDVGVTMALVIGEFSLISIYGFSITHETIDEDQSALWTVTRILNIFIIFRIVKIIPRIKSLSLVMSVVMDLLRNLKAFAGILIVMFYVFAIMGIELFHGAIVYKPEYVNQTFPCGTYEQLNYWANNFDDFFSSLVVLWDVMVVNNWHVFLHVFKERTSPWSYLFFIVWWLVSVIVIMNLFTALIMENFIMKWDRRHHMEAHHLSVSQATDDQFTESVYLDNDVHAMFRELLQEPPDNQLLKLIHEHHYLQLERG